MEHLAGARIVLRHMKKYDKPKVVVRGSSPEPVESGCCLRSCGGMPSPMSEKRGSGLALRNKLRKITK
jgi:hypothetical protein